MTTRAAIVAEAKRWIGTPFHWQAAKRGVGCDCKGLVVGVGKAVGLPEADDLACSIHDYGMVVDEALLRATLERLLRRVETPRPGDVMLMPVGSPLKAQHLGLFIGDGRMVHCYQAGPECVISVPIGRSRPIDSYWTWPSLGD